MLIDFQGFCISIPNLHIASKIIYMNKSYYVVISLSVIEDLIVFSLSNAIS